MPCEIVMYSVWTRKKGVRLFPIVKEAIDYQNEAMSDASLPLTDVSKIGKHPIKIEDAFSLETIKKEDEDVH